MSRAYTLYKDGLRYVRDIWDPRKYDFMNQDDVKLSLKEVHRDLWFYFIEFCGPLQTA